METVSVVKTSRSAYLGARGMTSRRRFPVLLLAATLLLGLLPSALEAHEISGVRSWSICHYEERYYVWTPNRPWSVSGRVLPTHAGRRVVLQRSKYGRSWDRWKATTTDSEGRFRFTGTAPDRGSSWWVNLRVSVPAQRGHAKAVGRSMYIDTNPYTRCV